MKAPQTLHEWLLFAFEEYEIRVIADKGNLVEIENDYVVEIEQNGIFKLLSGGAVVAPFNDLEELCRFIKLT